jgi:hypothetical protein
MAGVREALFPGGPSTLGGSGSLLASIAGADAPSVPLILVMLGVTTVAVAVLAALAFAWSERRAKDRGLIDLTSAY